MAEDRHRRTPKPGRARKRAIRARAASAGVPYLVAARQLESAGLGPGETLATEGRTVYPAAVDTHRRWSIVGRELRFPAEKLRDTRLAATLPGGRGRHLAGRFPPTRGPAGSGVGPLYAGDGREETLALLYLVMAHEAPGLVPAVGELAWIAELGEETALDTACAELDRGARLLLDADRGDFWRRVEAALSAGTASPDPGAAHEAVRLAATYRHLTSPRAGAGAEPYVPGLPLVGVRQILDALLVIAEDGHAPGTRVRLLTPPYDGQAGTIVGVHWGRRGAPVGYGVRPDGVRATFSTAPETLVVLARQES